MSNPSKKNWVQALFIRRLNRFSAEVLLNNQVVLVHVANTARMKELLTPHVLVMLTQEDNTKRKTQFTLRKVFYDGIWVSIDSIRPNSLVKEWLKSGVVAFEGSSGLSKSEVGYGHSRFDLYLQDINMLIEIKGVTLVREGIAMFPDAPTLRGKKHLEELCEFVKHGNRAAVVFVVQREDATTFKPNWAMDLGFCHALVEAQSCGVEIRVFLTQVCEQDDMFLREIPYIL